MTNDYPHIKCLHPRKIVNSYSHEVVVVPCGHCKACLMRKSYKNTQRCEFERIANGYCLFITLTYSNQYVPRVLPIRQDNGTTDWIGVNDRLQDNGEVYFTSSYDDSSLCALLEKCKLNGCLGILVKKDLQNYLKRVRKHISKYYNEKVRFYACGEYGPTTLRPHFHILLFFNSAKLAENIRQIVFQAWKMGIVDSSFVNGSASSYVASYVNSRANLPEVLASSTSRPFSSHSFFLGETILLPTDEELQRLDYKSIINRVVSVGGKRKDIRLWSTIALRFFPKCRQYRQATCSKKYDLYTLLPIARKEFPQATQIMQLARQLSIYYLAGSDLKSVSIVRDSIPLTSNYCTEDEKERLVMQIYNLLSVSKRFVSLTTPDKIHSFMSQIDEFWKHVDMSNLHSNLLKQEEVITEHNIDSIPLFYDNTTIDDVKSTRAYRKFVSDTDADFNKSVKHKKLNDSLEIFIKQNNL